MVVAEGIWTALSRLSGTVPVMLRTNETECGVAAATDEGAERWVTRAELAARWSVPVKTVVEWASKGTGPRYSRFGKYVRYRLSDVVAWENGRAVQHGPN